MATKTIIREFNLADIPASATVILIGNPGSGKSSCVDNIAYAKRGTYPVARVFCGTESGYKKWCEIYHPLFVTNGYSEEELKEHVLRQKKLSMYYGDKHAANYSLLVIDDVSDDPKLYKSKIMRGIFKLGSQHWHQLVLMCTQYALDFPPDIRKSVSYVFLFFESNDIERKKLYNNFGGICGSYENFCDLMDGITGDYTAMVIKNRDVKTKNITDNVFYFRSKILGKWTFGCKEYRKWGDARYNTKYQERVMM